jgi:tetratricopeptide (TPR) repeat protein
MRPEDLQSNATLGLALFESAQYEPALRYLNKALETAPGNEIVSMFIRVTRTRQQQVPLIDDMKRYAAANPTEVQVRLSLVQLLAYARRIDEADAYARQLYELNPRDTDVFQRIGVSYGTAGNHSEARRAYEHSLSIKENAAAHLGLTAIYANLGDPDRASASFERVLALKPDSPDIMLLYGRHLMNHGKRREALEVFKRSIALKPANGAAIYNAGILSEKLGEHDAALHYLDMLRPIDPRLARTLERCIALRILR